MDQIKVELLEIMGSDETVALAAWVSSGRGEGKDVEKFIERLANEGHDSCFEHIVTRWHMRVPQRIQVQILRHRIASYNVASARYNHKFDSLYSPEEMYEKTDWDKLACQLGCMSAACLDKYNELLESVKDHPEKKRIRELAAMYLPQGVMSEHVESINLRSLKNFLTLRDSQHAQLEIQQVAKLMKQELSKIETLKATNRYFLKI